LRFLNGCLGSVSAVKANDEAAGVDEESIEEFERNLKGNLCMLWNRLSSGSYFPSLVRAVEIPKKHGQGRVRILGVPTVADRIAQTVVRLYLEQKVECCFTLTRMAIDQGVRRFKLWESVESVAGEGIG